MFRISNFTLLATTRGREDTSNARRLLWGDPGEAEGADGDGDPRSLQMDS